VCVRAAGNATSRRQVVRERRGDTAVGGSRALALEAKWDVVTISIQSVAPIKFIAGCHLLLVRVLRQAI